MQNYYRYINLPTIPDTILSQLNYNFSEYQGPDANAPGHQWTSNLQHGYMWSDSFNQEINSWCQKNICDKIYWAFQIITKDLAAHIDFNTKTKFCYLLSTGGNNVATNFHDDLGNQIVDCVELELHRWHILKVDSFHSVTGIEPGKVRFAVTGKIF